MKNIIPILFAVVLYVPSINGQDVLPVQYEAFVFGNQGQIKMTYDARQRPNCVYLDGKILIAFNAGAVEGSTGQSKTRPMAITYDMATKEFSDIVVLGPESSDHHDGPVIWEDTEGKLHVFYGWHHDLGTHLVSRVAGSIGKQAGDWSAAPAPAPKMSYQWVYRIYDDKHLVFYRTDGHYSSWTYRITSDNGMTWEGPDNDVTDLDIHGGMDTDWSIYTAKAISHDRKYLHVGFIAYDDYRRLRSPEEIAIGELDKTRQHNPLYDNRRVSYDYNLYYVKVNLRTYEVTNYKGEILQTPIDLATANEKCMIWDTEWRGGSIVPSILVDKNEEVSFLHNISDVQHEDSIDYHYVRLVDGAWKHTRITHSNHEWNSGHISRDAEGVLHAYIIDGPGYLKSNGYMDKHGGGRIEEWISGDDGNTWRKLQDITPDPHVYPGWKFNNIQPVKDPDGNIVEGMLLCYGWKHPDNPEARGFLLIDKNLIDNQTSTDIGHLPNGLYLMRASSESATNTAKFVKIQ